MHCRDARVWGLLNDWWSVRTGCPLDRWMYLTRIHIKLNHLSAEDMTIFSADSSRAASTCHWRFHGDTARGRVLYIYISTCVYDTCHSIGNPRPDISWYKPIIGHYSWWWLRSLITLFPHVYVWLVNTRVSYQVWYRDWGMQIDYSNNNNYNVQDSRYQNVSDLIWPGLTRPVLT